MTSVSRSRVVALFVVAAFASAPLAAADDDSPRPLRALPETAAGAVRLDVAGTYETGLFDQSAAEITAFDPGTDRLFVVNADSGSVDVLDVSEPTAPVKVATLAVQGRAAADGSTVPADSVVNSVDVYDGTLAVAVEAPDKVGLGWALFFDTDGSYRSGVRAGSLPDMVTFTPDGSTVVVANEGEPADDFGSDPEGTVSIVDVTDLSTLDQGDVRTARFTAYEGGVLPEGVRVFGPDVPVPVGQDPAGRVARNLEPEYVAVAADSSTAWVSVQEANAIAEIDLGTGMVSDLWAIPLKDYSQPGQGLDPSNRDDAIAIDTWPVTGMAMPDGIAIYAPAGEPLLVTANEGDAREFGDYNEEARVGDDEIVLCPEAFGGADAVAALKDDAALGRLKVTTEDGMTGAGCYDELFAFGGRSFSILSTGGEVVFDSGDLIETNIARLVEQGDLPRVAWNSTNDETPSFDDRSDDKGPELESVAIGEVEGRTYAFVTLERIGGVMVFDITDPAQVQFTTYVNNRDFDVVVDGAAAPGMGDLGAEGVELIAGQDSPTGEPLLAVANEVSGTTTMFAISTVVPDRLAGADRYATAAKVAQSYPRGVDTAYVALGERYPDALAGAALAGAGADPVLLSRGDRVPAVTSEALRRLAPEEIVLLGGKAALSQAVADELATLAPVSRLEGANRYGTAAAVASRFPDPTRVFIASGLNFPDALAGAAVAGAQGAPVLLTDPEELSPQTQLALHDMAPASIVLLGGTSAVSAGVATALGEYGAVSRIAGEDRYETAALIADQVGVTPVVYLASGLDFPDALAGAALASAQGSVVLLSDPQELPDSTADALAEADPVQLVLLGGPAALSTSVAREATVYLE